MRSLARRLLLEVRLVFTALQFFTRVPVPAWVGFDPAWMPRSLRHLPTVGLLVGAWGALVLALASAWWPPAVAVGLSMAATVWLTGAFHEDGWADTCDGLGGAVPRDKALAIMKDSRIGSYGAVGVVLMLGLKAAVLSSLLTPWVTELNAAQSSGIHRVLLGWTCLGLVWAHAASRWAPVVLMCLLPYAGDAGQAKAPPLALRAGPRTLLGASLMLAVVALCLWACLNLWGWPVRTWWQAMGISSLGVLLAMALAARWFRQRLGGFTGDTLGACQQLAELAALLGWLAVIRPVSGFELG
ncbi:adenosylcobinamide-GDP ribazoletransferase [Aquabacterium lacunae]|uniref:adenosylcobinamide-GDP ribazoletransferase n=1 Tax=Aquabacterium lacunae TaxID=2528630 RepID=UPI001A913A87|nr:adenosylcobinamide-GDP ribazoletransferase [Aquabacterium lacunae]